MQRAITRLNIERFRKLLKNEHDETKRQKLLQLVAEEEAKLTALETQPKSKTRRSL